MRVNLSKQQDPAKEAFKIALFCGSLSAMGKSILDMGWVVIPITTGLIYFFTKNRIKQINMAAHTQAKEWYEQAVMISDDGLWECDLINKEFHTSIRYKENLGYEEGEIEDTLETWMSLVHPEDLPKEYKNITNYLNLKKGIYESKYRIKCSDGSYRWMLSKAKASWDQNGLPVHISGSHTDITMQKEMEDRLYSLAYYDTLTGLPNRFKFENSVKKKICQYQDTDNKFAILYMNIDNFRRINDTWGYEIGNEFLRYIAEVFHKYVDNFYLCSHLGGNEFAIIIDKVKNNSDIINELKIFLEEFNSPWEFKKQKIFVTFSTGIVIYPTHGDTLYLLLANSNTAMWHVKKHGKDGYGFYTKDMQTKRVNYIHTAQQIRKALKNNEFVVYYQPQIHLKTGKIMGMEALIRWEHPEKGIISPVEFIPLAEATGEIHALGRFVLESVCKQKRAWERLGYPPVIVGVNISGITLTRGDLAQEIKELLELYKVDGSEIKIEVTETAVMTDIDNAISTLNAIKDLGVKVALDDFGTGYSSLTYLQRLPIDVIKIDREFVKNIKGQDDDGIIVQVVVQIAEALNLEVIAEGVETREQLNYLINSNCEQAQGYFFAKPMSAKNIEEMLKANFNYIIN